jgi:hypothetical protein
MQRFSMTLELRSSKFLIDGKVYHANSARRSSALFPKELSA